MSTPEDQFHHRLSLVEKKIHRIKNNPAPTIPKYDLTVPILTVPCITVLGSTSIIFPDPPDAGNEVPFSITLDTDPPNVDGTMMILIGWYSPFGRTLNYSGVSDSRGHGGWAPDTDTGTYPFLFYASSAWSVPSPWFEAWIEVMTAVRDCSAGDYAAGDTITITDTTNERKEIILIALYLSRNCMLYQADGDSNNAGDINYANAIDYTAGSWPTLTYADFGSSFYPDPVDHSTCIVASIAFPAIPNHIPTPAGFALLDHVSGTNISFAAYSIDAPAGVPIDPGWDMTGATFGVSQYQLIKNT